MTAKRSNFQKTHLKVLGRGRPKGRNETKTSFETRKINLPAQKEKGREPTLKEMLDSLKPNTSVKMKLGILKSLQKHVWDNQDTLHLFFVDILKSLGKMLQITEALVRSEAILVLGQCAEILTDIQFKSFVAPLTVHLNCMMTHLDFGVKRDSLKFLDVLLKSHPSVICQSFEILFSLLNMISSKENSANRKGSKNQSGRKVCDDIGYKITAGGWRMEVLELVLTLLIEIVSKKNSSKIIANDPKEVHWDAKEALYLPLYLNSGVEPAKMDYSLYSSFNLKNSDSQKLKQFITELVCILSAILKGFPRNGSSIEDSEVVINPFRVITRILCAAAEWSIENIDLKDDWNPAKSLTSICCQLLRDFPYSQRLHQKSERAECMELDMEICYLYCMCSHLNDNPENIFIFYWNAVADFLGNMFSVSGAKLNEKSISLALKITRVMIQSKNLDGSAKEGMLLGLIGTLQTNKYSPAAKDLYAFFMEFSTNYDYEDHVAGSRAMRQWFQGLLDGLLFMIESKAFVPNYLNYIKQICARRNPYFMQTVNSLKSEKLIEWLKFDDEDFKFTIIHLIVSLDKISPDFLQELAECIREPTFSLKTATRLIRMLHSRFSKPGVPPTDQMNFVKFLLNLGCDTFLILDPTLDTDPLPLTDMLLNFQQSFKCPVELYPTSDFERHKEIFQVCADCLTPYIREEIHAKCLIFFLRNIFGYPRYPVHSAVAFVELFSRFRFLQNDVPSYNFLQRFLYSFLLYNSLITLDVPEDHWIEYCIPTVNDSFDQINILKVIEFMDIVVQKLNENQLLHVLRIFMFLMNRRYLDLVDKNILFSFLGKLRNLPVFLKRPIFKVYLNALFEYLRVCMVNKYRGSTTHMC